MCHSKAQILKTIHVLHPGVMSDHEDVELNLLYETPAHRAPIQTTTPKPSENLSHGKPSNSVNDLADAVSLFKTVIDSQFASLSEKLLSEQKASAKSLTKKIKDSKASRIQGEGNRIQFSFNEEIIDDLDNLCTATTINNEIKEKLLKEEQTD